jgi:ubiquinone/menaquinone biosynthesis C-methylase UbiE
MIGWDCRDNALIYSDFSQKSIMYKTSNAELISAVSIRRQDSVLDLCCGAGATFNELVSRGDYQGKAVLLDKSNAMIQLATTNVQYEAATFVNCDAESLCSVIDADTIDVALCNSTIWQLNFEKVLAQLACVLRKDGKFAFTMPLQVVFRSFTSSIPEMLSDRLSRANHVDMFSRLRKGESFEEYGFRINSWNVFDVITSCDELLDFYRIPVMTEFLGGDLSYEERIGLIEKASCHFKPSDFQVDRWACFVLKQASLP